MHEVAWKITQCAISKISGGKPILKKLWLMWGQTRVGSLEVDILLQGQQNENVHLDEWGPCAYEHEVWSLMEVDLGTILGGLMIIQVIVVFHDYSGRDPRWWEYKQGIQKLVEGDNVNDVSKDLIVTGGCWGDNTLVCEGDLGDCVPLLSKEKKRDLGGGNGGYP